MVDSVAKRALDLINQGLVRVTNITYNSFSTIVTTKDIDGNTRPHHVAIWRDGRYSCECEWFLKSKSVRLDLWSSNLLIKAECKHSLASKLTEHYERWIRMVKVETDDGYILKALEDSEEIHVKSLEEQIEKVFLKATVKVSKPLPPRKGILKD